MSQTVITQAFEQWKAQQAVSNTAIELDEFVFANVPGLDPATPINRAETLPPAAQIVYRQAITRKGVVNENAVVHSVVLGADVGDFSFNWIGLINKASGTLAMIVHAPDQQKLKTADGQQGNVLTRSFLMEYNGAQSETRITTPAETWQIDFTARLAGVDERQRLENLDVYGAGAFYGDGFLVTKAGTGYSVTKGVGYVGGLRAELTENKAITVDAKPAKVFLDVCFTGSLVSAWQTQATLTVAGALTDYEKSGVKHYVFAVASIDAAGNVTDLRPMGSLGDQALNARVDLKYTAQDATTTQKGIVQLSSETNSAAETLAATPKAVKAAYDLAAAKYTAVDAGTVQKGIVQLSSATDSSAETLAATPKAVKAAYDLAAEKFTAVDASTVQKGIVQLSSDVDNPSELLAATSKAVKAANDNANGRVPVERTINGSPLANDIVITTHDIFHGQAVEIRNAADLNSFTTPGLYFQPDNSQAINGTNYPEDLAGSLEVYRHAGITQVYRIYNSSRCYMRTFFNSVWTGWARAYDTLNKPTPADIGALPVGGTAVAALKLATTRYINGAPFDGTGDVTLSAAAVGAYTKAENHALFQPLGSYTPAGQAYTKAESDGRFQLMNSAYLGEVGWFRDTNTGMLIQYGKVAISTDGQGVAFPLTFSIVPSLSLTVNSGSYGDVGATSLSATGFVVKATERNIVGYIAIGR
ncbi:Phage tail fibre repeat-containing protein [Enterobacter sp. kpr-6]|uniref:tail fiber protein n=1 Tax=Enterobacter sp. kpr-6 TaxID=1761782 RepID=UPI0008EF7761|nr:tail fiber protein [Enterobacter sp. kpr-6]SFR13638.1 Phage tail fibre repeat-containing protein [Enterobacter sp. kpr-6]